MSRLDKRPSSLVLSAADEGSITREGPLMEGPTMWVGSRPAFDTGLSRVDRRPSSLSCRRGSGLRI